MELKKLMVEHSINEFWQRLKIRNRLLNCVLRRKELRMGHLSYRKCNGVLHRTENLRWKGLIQGPKGRAEGKQEEDDYTRILHSRTSKMLKNTYLI
jgi:hypothetical protein